MSLNKKKSVKRMMHLSKKGKMSIKQNQKNKSIDKNRDKNRNKKSRNKKSRNKKSRNKKIKGKKTKIKRHMRLASTKQYQQYYNKINNKLKKYKNIEDKYNFLSNEHNKKDLNKLKSVVIIDILEELKKTSATEKNINLLYPNIYDPNFNKKIYNKEEFYANRIIDDPKIANEFYEEHSKGNLANANKQINSFMLSKTQKLLKNFINSNTPYNSLLLFHGVGVGKTCAAISIIEQFKEQVNTLGKKILIIRHKEI